jgi:hypothetical protein
MPDPALEVLENTGDFRWLAVRDDFRKWIVTAVQLGSARQVSVLQDIARTVEEKSASRLRR